MCLVQLRAETSKPNSAGAVSAKEVNSDPRAMREEEGILQKIYECLPPVNFSRALLERIPEYLSVMRVSGVHWSDWGDQCRIEQDIVRLGSAARKAAYV